jgi:hypothetical protein
VGSLKIDRPNSNRVSKRLNAETSEGSTLRRDLDGFVHTPAGYLPAAQYRKVREENPAAGLPKYEDIELLDG